MQLIKMQPRKGAKQQMLFFTDRDNCSIFDAVSCVHTGWTWWCFDWRKRKLPL